MIAGFTNRLQLRIAALLFLLPALALATDRPNVVEVSPTNSERLGVRVFVARLTGRYKVTIIFPPVIDGVWLAEKAEIYVSKAQERAIFEITTGLGLKDSSPIKFWFDDQDGNYDATVIIHYACANLGDERCGGFPGLTYNIVSIAAFPKVPRRDFSRTPEGIAPTKESTDR